MNPEQPRFDPDKVLSSAPVLKGRSKTLYAIDEHFYLVRMMPTLDSFTFDRRETIQGTAELRLDFYEGAVRQLRAAGVAAAFQRRIGPDLYVAEVCTNPPFEVIVKNRAVGSTLRKYPGLFPEGHRFAKPVVKFDFRVDPEDQPIADDYLREAGLRPDELKRVALLTNDVLRRWLAPRDLWDFCIVVGERRDGSYAITSEISPDCMRLRAPTGQSLDKDLFRHGAGGEELMTSWRELVASLERGEAP